MCFLPSISPVRRRSRFRSPPPWQPRSPSRSETSKYLPEIHIPPVVVASARGRVGGGDGRFIIPASAARGALHRAHRLGIGNPEICLRGAIVYPRPPTRSSVPDALLVASLPPPPSLPPARRPLVRLSNRSSRTRAARYSELTKFSPPSEPFLHLSRDPRSRAVLRQGSL